MMDTARISAVLDALLQRLIANSGLTLTYEIKMFATQVRPLVSVDVAGDDVLMLTARNGELLLAMEHVAAKVLRLEPEEHDVIRFEAASFKANREVNLQQAAALAVEQVRRTGRALEFQPMSSHERRMLHLALAPSGLTSASEGEGAMRRLVLHPPPRQ